MKILVACEESQAVTIRLREQGHEAYSCDIQQCSGGRPEWHLQQDVTELLQEQWDGIIAFPPCTHLAVSGARHFAQKRADGRQREAIEFFMQFLNADSPRIAVENPVGIIGGGYVDKFFPDIITKFGKLPKPTQYIQPYEHGDQATKKTGLWLKGLPKINPTNIVDTGESIVLGGKNYQAWHVHSRDESGKCLSWNHPETAKIRSKTFPGIADAMATQWFTGEEPSKYADPLVAQMTLF